MIIDLILWITLGFVCVDLLNTNYDRHEEWDKLHFAYKTLLLIGAPVFYAYISWVERHYSEDEK